MSGCTSYRRILNRTFKIDRDLTKYSKQLNYKETERKFEIYTKTARGRNLYKLRARAKVVKKHEVKWNVQREMMKNTDWRETDIFKAYTLSVVNKKPIEVVLK